LDATLEAAATTRIRLCGRLVVEMDGRRLESALPSRQGRLVFAYLVLHRTRAIPRSEIVEALWPERAPEAALTLLTELLSRLRRALPAGVLEGRAQLSLRLDADAWIDVERATEAARQAREAPDARAAIAIASRGLDLLASPLLPDADRPWIDEARRALDELKADLLELVARAGLRAAGDELATAEGAARRLIELEPFRESAHALLMEVHAARGDVAEALRVYDALRTLLRDELGTVPAPAVRAFADRLLTAPAVGAVRGLPAPLHRERTFVGRAGELARVLDVWRSGAGSRRLVLLTGEPGVGKTSLAAAAAAQLEPTGAAVLYGRSDPEPLAPYQPFTEALGEAAERAPGLIDDGHSAVLARILPRVAAEPEEAGGDGAQAERHRLFDAVTQTITTAAGDRRALLVVDDAHWADRPTLLLLRYLLRHGPAGLTVLATVRPFEESRAPLRELVVELRSDGHVERILLEGLDPGTTGKLVAARTAAVPHPEFVRWIQQRTGGNPFYTEEVLRELRGIDITAPPVIDTLDRARTPEGVRDLVAQRLSRLSADAAEALRIAATLGPEVRLADLERVVGDSALAALEEAVASGLVREIGDAAGRFAFVHALAREAIRDSMTVTGRAALHLRVGDALEADASPAALAHHFDEARHLAGPDKAVRYHVAAAEASARALAYEAEIDHYERAVAILDETGSTDDETRCRLILAAADRIVTLGGDVRERMERTAEIAERAGLGEWLARAAVAHARVSEHGRLDRTSVTLLEKALVALGPGDSAARARVLGRLAEALYADPAARERRDALSRQAVEMARRAGDDETLALAISSRSRAIAGPDHLAEGLELSLEALEIAQRIDVGSWTASVRVARVSLFTQLTDIDAACAELRALGALLDRFQFRGTYNDAERARLEATQAVIAGDLEGAERLAHEAHGILAAATDPDAELLLTAQLIPVRIAQARGDELLPMVTDRAAASGGEHAWKALLGLLHLQADRRPQARDELLALAADEFGAIPVDEDWLGTLVVLAELCSVVGEPEHSRALIGRLRPYADRLALLIYSALPVGMVSHALGQLADSVGDADEAAAWFDQALAAAQAMNAPLLAASTRAALRRRA
jgi:DNA-binding SARP family transcriptional activator